MDKKLKIILVILILIIISIFLIIGILFSPSSIDKGYQDQKIPVQFQEKEDNNTYKYTPMINTLYSEVMTSEEKKELEKVIDEMLEILNQKDYEAFYEKLSLDCKEYLYPSLDEFRKQYQPKLQNYTYTCEEYVADFYGYECVFYPINMQGNEENNIEIIFKINSQTKETTIILESLIDVKKINGVRKEGALNVTCLSQLNYLDKTVYTLKFVNVGYVKIEVDINEVAAVKVINGYQRQEQLENIPTFTLKGQEIKILELEFDAYNYSSLKPEWLRLSISKNSEPMDLEYYLAYEEHN